MTLKQLRDQTNHLPDNTEITLLNKSMASEPIVVIAATEDGVVLDLEADND